MLRKKISVANAGKNASEIEVKCNINEIIKDKTTEMIRDQVNPLIIALKFITFIRLYSFT
jgi:hypothetical protein